MSPSLQTMGFFMSDINFCNTKEQLNHLGEVVTGKTNGSPSGADIDTSTLPYTGQVRKTLPALEQEYIKAIQGAGGVYVGVWASGVTTFNAYNEYSVYNGVPYKPRTSTALPYTSQGADPTSAPDEDNVQPYAELTTIGLGGVTNYLCNSVSDMKLGISIDGTEIPITENQVWEVVLDGYSEKYQVVSYISDIEINGSLWGRRLVSDNDYTTLNGNLSMASGNAKSASQTLDVVVTGDSLSFNAFGYNSVPSFPGNYDGTLYATQNPFGIMSWAHLLRDSWVASHDYFRPIDECKKITNCKSSRGVPSSLLKNFGMNVKAMGYTFNDVSQIMKLTHSLPVSCVLIVSYSLLSDAVLFEVDGVEYDNTSPDGHYYGNGYMMVPCSANDIVITNVRKKSDGGEGELWIYGVTGSSNTIPKLTGKGGYRSDQILDEYSTLVGAYQPSVVYYIIGANDYGTNSVSQFKANVSSFIDNVYSDDPDAVIVLISPPPSSSYTSEDITPFIRALYELAISKNCSSIDMYSAFSNIDPSYYRYDNIHWSKRGDDIAYDFIVNKTISLNENLNDRFSPTRENFIGINGISINEKSNTESVIVTMTSGSPSFSSNGDSTLSSAFSGVYLTDGVWNICSVVVPYGYTITSVDGYYSNSTDLTRTVKARRISPDSNTVELFVSGASGMEAIDGSGRVCQLSIGRNLAQKL